MAQAVSVPNRLIQLLHAFNDAYYYVYLASGSVTTNVSSSSTTVSGSSVATTSGSATISDEIDKITLGNNLFNNIVLHSYVTDSSTTTSGSSTTVSGSATASGVTVSEVDIVINKYHVNGDVIVSPLNVLTDSYLKIYIAGLDDENATEIYYFDPKSNDIVANYGNKLYSIKDGFLSNVSAYNPD